MKPPLAQHAAPASILASASVQRVIAALAAAGVQAKIIVHAQATPSSQAAADVLGVHVGQIAKSVIFRAKQSGSVVLVIASGAHRVDEQRVAAAIGEPIGKADADFVKERTGFSIGGVAPVGHLSPPLVLLDETLMSFDTVYPAAGHPNTGFALSPADLARAADARVCAVAQGAAAQPVMPL